jgi:hypothetical protein
MVALTADQRAGKPTISATAQAIGTYAGQQARQLVVKSTRQRIEQAAEQAAVESGAGRRWQDIKFKTAWDGDGRVRLRPLGETTSGINHNPPAWVHARVLLASLSSSSQHSGKWIPARDLAEVAYPEMCGAERFQPRSWLGRYGVAAHLNRLTVREYKLFGRPEGGQIELLAYYIPTRKEWRKGEILIR